MKALVLVKAGATEGANSGQDMKTCIASLKSLSISHHMAHVSTMPTDAYVNTHDFIVIPSLETGFNTVIDDSGITIPFMCLGVQTSGAALGATPGVSGSRSALEDDFYTFPWSSEEYFAAYGGSFTLTTGTALMTVSATEPAGTGGAAQANSGKVAMWSSTTSGGSRIYYSSIWPNNHPMLPFLIQAAIDDGVLSAPPTKAPLCVDIDHINGIYASAEESILDKIASYVPEHGVIHAGIYNGSVDYLDNMTATMAAKLLKYQNRPFKYNWHDHVLSPIIGANLDSEGYSTDHTKATISAQYLSDEAVWNGLGLSFADPAYNNPGSDSFDEGTLQLYSADSSKVSSPADDTTQAGFGFIATRAINTSSSRKFEVRTSTYINYSATKKKFRGIQFFPAWDMAFNTDMPYNSIVDWRNNFNYLTRAISMSFILYMHDEDFISTDQAPGESGKQHGYVQMQMIADTGAYLKDVCEPFADITNRVPLVNFA